MTSEAGAKRPLVPTDESSLNASTKRVRAERPANKKGGGSTWDVTGRYEVQCTCKFEPVDASDYVLDIHFEQREMETETETETAAASTFRLYAFFDFPNLNLRGVMRLCPKSALSSRSDDRLFLPEFEAACDLAESAAPGPKNKEWLMRWRGEEGGRKVGGETRAQALFVFGRNNSRASPTAESSEQPGIQVLFGMVHNGKHLLFQGTHASKEIPTVDPDAVWQWLFEPSWEESDPAVVNEEEARCAYNQWENPRPGSVIKARNKPGPDPGYVINRNASSPYLEDRPDWAWNVTGTYKISCPELAERIGHDGSDEQEKMEMLLTIFMENNSKRQKTGRQLWGQFDFGILRGNMRFCPGSLAEFGVDDRTQPFEAVCVLKPGVWPGPQPKGGERKWGFMWRGFKEDAGLVTQDYATTEIIFADYGEERTTFVGTFRYDGDGYPMQALKIKPGVERSRGDPTPNTEWLKYKPKHLI